MRPTIRSTIRNPMKKIIFPLIAILLLAIGLVGWRSPTYSKSGPPYANPNEDGPEGLTKCTKTIANQKLLMRTAWQKNLSDMMAQEKPASEMVDEGFESLRTYRCWLDYLCEAVMYSANRGVDENRNQAAGASGDSLRPLTEAEIELVPGCASPESLQIPETQIEYIPACRVGNEGTIEAANDNYVQCREMVEQDMSIAFIALEKTLKDNSSQQQIRPLRDKFTSIIMKMAAMKNHMAILKGQLEGLDLRLPCYAKKCD
jgi:hypothetical protein